MGTFKFSNVSLDGYSIKIVDPPVPEKLVWDNFSVYKVISNTPSANSSFGFATELSQDGTTLAVGAPNAFFSGRGQCGTVSIYVWNGGSWDFQDSFIGADTSALDNFGTCLSLSSNGDTLVVGSPGDDLSGLSSGSAYVFQRSGTTWSEVQKLTPSTPQVLANFGHGATISYDSSKILVGAHGFQDSRGKVFVFELSGLSSWNETQDILGPVSAQFVQFGMNLYISGDGTRFISGTGDRDLDVGSGSTVSGFSNSGLVFIYKDDAGNFILEETLSSPQPEDFGYFGKSVSINETGDKIVIGAEGENNFSGRSYVYARSGTVWSSDQEITPAVTSGESSQYGFSTGISDDGTIAVVGSPYWTVVSGASSDNPGGGWIWCNDGTTWIIAQSATSITDQTATPNFEEFAYSIGTNGDGTRIVFGTRREDHSGISDAGAAYIFHDTT